MMKRTVLAILLFLVVGCSKPRVQEEEPQKEVVEAPQGDHPFAKLGRGECPCPDGDYILFLHNEDEKTILACVVKGSEAERKHKLHMDTICCEAGDTISPTSCPELYGRERSFK